MIILNKEYPFSLLKSYNLCEILYTRFLRKKILNKKIYNIYKDCYKLLK